MSNEMMLAPAASQPMMASQGREPAHLTTASESAAALASAEIQAKFTLALRRPRNIDDVRVALLRDCRRPGFAKEAWYSYELAGEKIEGPTIRFAESAIRTMTNIDVRVSCVHDDDQQRKMAVSVLDLEANVSYSQEVTIQKTVERRNPPDGAPVIGTRQNSRGQTVYLLVANDREVEMKVSNALSRTIRVLSLRLLPGWLKEEAEQEVLKTNLNADAADPEQARRALVDAFASLGVKASQLEAYLGHGLSGTAPGEITKLRAIYQAIRDGMVTWAQATDGQGADPQPEQDPLKQQLSEKLRRPRKPRQPRAPEPTQEQPLQEEKECHDTLLASNES